MGSIMFKVGGFERNPGNYNHFCRASHYYAVGASGIIFRNICKTLIPLALVVKHYLEQGHLESLSNRIASTYQTGIKIFKARNCNPRRIGLCPFESCLT